MFITSQKIFAGSINFRKSFFCACTSQQARQRAVSSGTHMFNNRVCDANSR